MILVLQPFYPLFQFSMAAFVRLTSHALPFDTFQNLMILKKQMILNYLDFVQSMSISISTSPSAIINLCFVVFLPFAVLTFLIFDLPVGSPSIGVAAPDGFVEPSSKCPSPNQ